MGWDGGGLGARRGAVRRLDPIIDRFARCYQFRVTKNLKDWPERSIVWKTDVRCLIQVFLADRSALTMNLWICASQDRDAGRFWKKEMLRQNIPVSALENELLDLLEAGKRQLEARRASRGIGVRGEIGAPEQRMKTVRTPVAASGDAPLGRSCHGPA